MKLLLADIFANEAWPLLAGLALLLALAALALWAHRRGVRAARAAAEREAAAQIKVGERRARELEQEAERLRFLLEKQKQERPASPETGGTAGLGQFKELEQERIRLQNIGQEFQEKNKKLWELSTSIHKEKQRVETLRRAIEEKHRVVTDSINYAQRIQRAVLPPDELLPRVLPEHFVLFRPRDIVSGDFYWARQVGRKTVVVAADCTGHGVPGAFMSMLGISFLNEILQGQDDPRAASILEALRAKVKSALRQQGRMGEAQDGMDLALAILDPEARKVEFAGANNPLWLLRRDGLPAPSPDKRDESANGHTLYALKPTKNPIGIFLREKPFAQETLELLPGDRLYLFSDGLPDQVGGPKGDKFKAKRFKQFLLATLDLPMDQQKAALERELDQWIGKHHQVDDILVIGLKP